MTIKTPDLGSGKPEFLKIALCQISTQPFDLEGNLRRTLEALAQAAAQGAELAITPECVLTGYSPHNTPGERRWLLEEGAAPPDGPALSAIRDAARSHGMALVVGYAEKAPGGALHNTAEMVLADGSTAYAYRKVHCRPFESAEADGLFAPGGGFHAADLRTPRGASFRIGTMICFDREIPESTRCLRALGSEFIACPLATNTDRLDAWRPNADNEAMTRIRAAENEVFIAVVNHAGAFNGGTFVVGPGGECLVQLGAEPEVRVVDVPVGIVRGKFHSDPWGWAGWGYRRPEVYAKHLAGG